MRLRFFGGEGGGPTLNYAEGPPTGPPMVLLHGGAWRWQEFIPLVPGLSTRWHLLAPDLRGHGLSGRAPGHYRLREFADDIVRFLTQRVGEPAVLLGHSVGGVIAFMAASRSPGAVSALILEDLPLDMGPYRTFVSDNRRLYVAWRDLARSGRTSFEMLSALADLAVDLPGGRGSVRLADVPGVTSDWLLFMAGCLARMDPEFLTALLDDFEDFVQGYDPEAMLKTLDCPVLVLRGEPERGAVLTDAELERAPSLHPRLAVARIEGVGHELHMGRAEPVLRSIVNFLDML